MSNKDDNNSATPDENNSDNEPKAEKTVIVDVPEQLGMFKLTRLLGRGGMGEVWMGFDTSLERNVAIKLMRKELLANQEAVRRFGREARAVARLNHSNIVHVYTFGEEDGLMYFVMEMVEGETVADRIKEAKQLPLDEAVRILIQAIEGLDYAHARGIIHRDIKPANLMLTPDFRVKIADFGLAKMVEQDTQMTAAGTTMGSPNYMSPEQARGSEADHRADIYALGITFYQMLTGELPFTAQSPLTVLLKHIQDPLPEPMVLRTMQDGRVYSVIRKMTEKDPENRFQNYQGLAAALASLTPGVHYQGSHMPTSSVALNSRLHEDDLPGSANIGSNSAENHTAYQKTAINTEINQESDPTPIAVPIKENKDSENGGSGFPIAALIGFLALLSVGGIWWFSRAGNAENTPAPLAGITPTAAAPTAVAEPTPSPTPEATPSPKPTATPRAAIPVYTPVATVRPSLTPSLIITPNATRVSKYKLGTDGAGPNERVPVYLDALAKMEYQKLPAGTLVDFLSEEVTSYKVKLETGREVYVLKKMASPAQ